LNSISIFEIFKIGIGPSSSHTLGPWKAAKEFIEQLDESFDRIEVQLYGSLSKTGKGHATDIAVQLGLSGYDIESIPVDDIESIIRRIEKDQKIRFNNREFDFTPNEDILFERVTHSLHPNTIIFSSLKDGEKVKSQTYASVGGGFIEKEKQEKEEKEIRQLPFPINHGKDILKYTDQRNCNISDIVFQNELIIRSEEEVQKKISELVDVMLECVYRGCNTDGTLPGGLNVKRRAKGIHQKLLGDNNYSKRSDWIQAVKGCKKEFRQVNQWISCFALAVNEENASMRRVVTSPTNGAAGVIPAVLLYYYLFCEYEGDKDIQKFLLTAGEIGCLFKKGATISAAVGGCQAEIGVSSSMAAAGLTEVMGGTPRQVLMAAEIAMEHHLGLTCDPVGGLVQIPCIERKAMGAIKAITASNIALASDPEDAKVDLDTVIKTMWETAQEMNGKYKETSEGGLAFNLPVFYPEC